MFEACRVSVIVLLHASIILNETKQTGILVTYLAKKKSRILHGDSLHHPPTVIM